MSGRLTGHTLPILPRLLLLSLECRQAERLAQLSVLLRSLTLVVVLGLLLWRKLVHEPAVPSRHVVHVSHSLLAHDLCDA